MVPNRMAKILVRPVSLAGMEDLAVVEQELMVEVAAAVILEVVPEITMVEKPVAVVVVPTIRGPIKITKPVLMLGMERF